LVIIGYFLGIICVDYPQIIPNSFNAFPSTRPKGFLLFNPFIVLLSVTRTGLYLDYNLTVADFMYYLQDYFFDRSRNLLEGVAGFNLSRAA